MIKFENIQIKNNSLCFENQSIYLLENSVNLLKGKNGIGKTTIIKYILFDDKCQIHEKAVKERGQCFAYVPQVIPTYECSVIDYLSKGSQENDEKIIEQLLELFYLKEIELKNDFSKLSGGEKTKLAIMSAILSSKPILVLDEPTNNLDNQSVEQLIHVLNSFCGNKTILVVSHDKRFVDNIEIGNIIEVQSGRIINSIDEKCKAKYNLECQGETIGFNKSVFLTSIFRNKFGYVSLFLSSLFLSLLCMFNYFLYDSYFAEINNYPPNGVINSYKADYYFGELNHTYAEATGIEVDKNLYDRLILYNDLSIISNFDGVKEILVIDHDYILDIVENTLHNNTSLRYFSFPEDYIVGFSGRTSEMINQIVGNLVVGRYPQDNRNEICLTEACLVKECGVEQRENIEEYLGNTVTIEGINYNVTGILNNQYGFCLISFKSVNDNYGCYSYSEKSMEHIDDTELTEELLIYVEASKEKEILNQLICAYPAENYVSNIFDLVWCKEANRTFFVGTILPFNAVLACIFCVIMLMLQFFKLKKDNVIIEDYDNYCLNKKKVRQTYMIGNRTFIILMVGMALLINSLLSRYAKENWWIIFIVAAIVYVPAEIVSWKGI